MGNSQKLFYSFVLFFLILPLILQLSCSSPTDPNDNLQPGRRDYVWSVDTLYSPNNTLHSIWGAAPDDVWLAGPGGITPYDGLWHFDGAKWKPYQQALLVSANCLFGLDKNNVWIGGNDGKIWRFNGNEWYQDFMYQKGGAYTIEILDIQGNSLTDLYAVGVIFFDPVEIQRGFILHYDGISWKEKFVSNTKSQYLKIHLENGKAFVFNLISSLTVSDSIEFYEYTNEKLNKIFAKSLDDIIFGSISKIGDKLYFLIGRDLTIYQGKEFTKILSFSEQNFGYHVAGRNENDIFIRMRDGIAHYNGENIVYLYQFPNLYTSYYNMPLIFDNEIFFAVHDNLNEFNIVLHGILNK